MLVPRSGVRKLTEWLLGLWKGLTGKAWKLLEHWAGEALRVWRAIWMRVLRVWGEILPAEALLMRLQRIMGFTDNWARGRLCNSLAESVCIFLKC